jgi:hypothetical protein
MERVMAAGASYNHQASSFASAIAITDSEDQS